MFETVWLLVAAIVACGSIGWCAHPIVRKNDYYI